MFSIEGKNVFIAGGATGIGLAVVKRFAAAGANVMVADIKDVRGTMDDLGVLYTQMDVAEEAQVASALQWAAQQLGKLDVLINNVGVFDEEKPFSEYDSAAFDRLINVNVKGMYHGLKHGPGHMKDGGSIINTVSQVAFTHIPQTGPYAATKAAGVSMTMTAALEMAPRNIRVNGVAPTLVDTPFYEVLRDEDINLCKYNIPLGRVSVPEDLAGTFHFLASDESAFITGHILHVNGGWTAGLSYGLLEKTTRADTK